jgi:hypothetical protein
MRRTRRYLTFANVVSVIALFIALGGTAMASVIITSNGQVAQNTISGHQPPSGKHANVIAGSINGSDIADRSGVDTCQTPLVAKYGPICAGSDAVARTWGGALNYCAGLDLRLPTASEAVALGNNHDVPGVSGSQSFWTGEESISTTTTEQDARVSNEAGGLAWDRETLSVQTVCVTDPSA